MIIKKVQLNMSQLCLKFADSRHRTHTFLKNITKETWQRLPYGVQWLC